MIQNRIGIPLAPISWIEDTTGYPRITISYLALPTLRLKQSSQDILMVYLKLRVVYIDLGLIPTVYGF
jgi:hypothetical protein